MFRLAIFIIFIGLYSPFVFGLLNHDLPTTPDGLSPVDVWKELYALHDKVSTLQIENKDKYQDNNALKAQGAGLQAHSPVKCEIPKNTRPRHLKKFRTQYIFVSNCF